MMTPDHDRALASLLDEVRDRRGWTRERMASEVGCTRRQLAPTNSRIAIDQLHHLAQLASIDDQTFDDLLAPADDILSDGSALETPERVVPVLLHEFQRAVDTRMHGAAAITLAQLSASAHTVSERRQVRLCEIQFLNASGHPQRAVRLAHRVSRAMLRDATLRDILTTELARAALLLHQPHLVDALLSPKPLRTLPPHLCRLQMESLRRRLDHDPTAARRTVLVCQRLTGHAPHAARLEAHAAAGDADPRGVLDDLHALMDDRTHPERLAVAAIAADHAARHLDPDEAERIVAGHAHRILARARSTRDWRLHGEAFRLQMRVRALRRRPTWHIAARRVVELFHAIERFPWLLPHLHDLIAVQAAGNLIISHAQPSPEDR